MKDYVSTQVNAAIEEIDKLDEYEIMTEVQSKELKHKKLKEICGKYGFSFQVYKVLTEDNQILEIFHVFKKVNG